MIDDTTTIMNGDDASPLCSECGIERAIPVWSSMCATCYRLALQEQASAATIGDDAS